MSTKNNPGAVHAGASETSPRLATILSPRADGTGLDQAIGSASTDWWFRGALLAIKQLARSGRGFTADHVLAMVGAPTGPHYVGAAFAAARRQRIVEAVGARLGQDGRLVRVWLGVPH
jgi:hypothetical protein